MARGGTGINMRNLTLNMKTFCFFANMEMLNSGYIRIKFGEGVWAIDISLGLTNVLLSL